MNSSPESVIRSGACRLDVFNCPLFFLACFGEVNGDFDGGTEGAAVSAACSLPWETGSFGWLAVAPESALRFGSRASDWGGSEGRAKRLGDPHL